MESGASANWEEEFYFIPIDHQNKKMLVAEVWDSDQWTAHDLIGSALIGLSSTPPDSRCQRFSRLLSMSPLLITVPTLCLLSVVPWDGAARTDWFDLRHNGMKTGQLSLSLAYVRDERPIV